MNSLKNQLEEAQEELVLQQLTLVTQKAIIASLEASIAKLMVDNQQLQAGAPLSAQLGLQELHPLPLTRPLLAPVAPLPRP